MLAGREEEVVEMYLRGHTIPELEEHFGTSDAPIVRILNEAGIKRRVGRPPGRPNGALPPLTIPDPTVPDVRKPPSPPADASNRSARYKVPSTGPRASKAIQDEVFRRDGFRCRLCGSGHRLTVEFAIPPEKGGDAKNPKDLRTVCATCLSKPVEEPVRSGGILRKLLGR